MPLVNYRTNIFNLFDKRIMIAGVAGPHNHDDPRQALLMLSKYGRTVLIGLHENLSFPKEANEFGIDYYHIPIDDFPKSPIDPKIYDDLYNIIKDATSKGRQVTIHCGTGNGRTGTALAALKMREMLEKQLKENPCLLNEKPKMDSRVIIIMPSIKTFTCTALVKKAVYSIRYESSSHDRSGIDSVETKNDVRTLIAYEKHLRSELLKVAKVDISKDKYGYANWGKNGYSFFPVSINGKYSEMKSDLLKTKILYDFQSSIKNVAEPEELQRKIDDFKKSDEYKVLETGQDLATRILHTKTGSIKKFNEIVAKAKAKVTKASPK